MAYMSPDPVSRPFDIVAMCASAGGFAALKHVLERLPATFAAPVVIVQHLDPRHETLMADLLARHCQIRVEKATATSVVAPGALIAPPNNHMLVNADGTITLTQTELVHFVRPSADLLFESVAAGYRERAIAVVLTGTGQDGAQGVRAIKTTGGTVIAQDEASSDFYGMPSKAIETGCVDFVLALDDIPSALVSLVMPELAG
jgi:two-component system, chemotaxis family, protein-glutamate methylesterase/glutaminase